MLVHGVRMSTTTMRALRGRLGVKNARWAEQAQLKELLYCAWPRYTSGEIRLELQAWMAKGQFLHAPKSPELIYDMYAREYGVGLPFEAGTQSLQPPAAARELQQAKTAAPAAQLTQPKEIDMSELKEAKAALLNVLHQLQDPSQVETEGKFDQSKADLLFKRAAAIGDVVGQMNNIQRTQLEATRAQMDACRLALDHGYSVAPESFGLPLLAERKENASA